MKVILVKDVAGLGAKGTLHDVKEGYARNFLFPRGLAVEATVSQVRAMENQSRSRQEKEVRRRTEAERLAAELEKTVVTVKVKVGEGGRLFGSVTPQHVADALQGRGFSIDKRQIELEDPIKMTGYYKVRIRVDQRLVARVDVNVTPAG